MTDLSAYGGLGRSGPLWPESWRQRRPDLSAGGLLVAVVVWLAIVLLAQPDGTRLGTGQEAISYWGPGLDAMYANAAWTTTGAYVYSPAFLQLISPLKALPWVAFLGVWTAILMVAVRFLTGPRLFAIGIVLATAELAGGNISLLLAAAIVVGFRWPAAWALILLTKVSPGIGLLWFAVRREWRNLGIALAATAAVIAISVVIKPGAWLEWFDVLSSIAGRDPTWAAIPIPLAIRLPIAVAVVVWGARTDRRWTVPVACMLALPALWYGGLTMLLAVIVLRQQEESSSLAPAPSDGGLVAEPAVRTRPASEGGPRR
ncbi:MAG: glycosyltransferase 87 family protein [Chloroflexota bacterium]